MCKYSKDKLEECASWVAEHGLYPQRGGASITSFCRAMGISDHTLASWSEKKPEFNEAIKKANRKFAQKTVERITNALVEKACGYTRSRSKLIEQGVVSGEGKLKTKQATRYTEDIVYPPDTAAAIFLLTNMDAESWKNKQNTELEGGVRVEKPQIIFRDQEESSAGEE